MTVIRSVYIENNLALTDVPDEKLSVIQAELVGLNHRLAEVLGDRNEQGEGLILPQVIIGPSPNACPSCGRPFKE